MSTTSSWDQLKKVREEEFFYKDERDKIAALKAQREKSRAFMTETKEKMAAFERGFSPVRGMNMFRANIAGDLVLDCPEEGTVTMTYDVLEKLLKEAKLAESDMLKKWEQFIEVAIDAHADDGLNEDAVAEPVAAEA